MGTFKTETYALSEEAYLKEIKNQAARNNHTQLKKTVTAFFKTYPKSEHIAEVRLISADTEPDPKQAISQYYKIVKYYKYFPQRNYAQYKICNYYELLQEWKQLEQGSLKGMTLFGKKDSYYHEFRYYHALSLYYQQRFEEALKECDTLKRQHHRYHDLAALLLLETHCRYQASGNVSDYYRGLYETHQGFQHTGYEIGALMLFAKHHEEKRNYSVAYSAYKDITTRYPRSPEAFIAQKHLDRLKQQNPRYVTNYFNIKKTNAEEDSLDISPEYDINDDPNAQSLQYAIAIGPFYNLKRAETIKKLLQFDFKPVVVVKKRRYIMVYAGRATSEEGALTMKIRIAEEFGFNGTIIYIQNDAERQYIYGDE